MLTGRFASLLLSPAWGWVTAWMNMLGQLTITAGIDIAVVIYFVGLVSRGLGVPDTASCDRRADHSWTFYLIVMVILMIPQTLINAFGIHLTALYKMAPFALVFPLTFLQAQWTFTGYDASAHMAEETVMARLNSSWGVLLSVAISAVIGYIVLLAFTWSIPNGDIASTALDPHSVLYIAYQSLSFFLANVVAVIVFFGIGLVPERLGAGDLHYRNPVHHLHLHHLHVAAQRAGAVDQGGFRRSAGDLLVRLVAQPLQGPAEGLRRRVAQD